MAKKSELSVIWIKNIADPVLRNDELRLAILKEFEDVFPDELPKGLPPSRNVDHKIELEPGISPPNRPV